MANISLSEYNRMNKKYSYKIGKLFNKSEQNEIEPIGEESVFDDANINYHLYPQNDEDRNKLNEEIEAVYETLKKALKDICTKKEGLKLVKTLEELDGCEKDDGVIYFWANSRGTISGVKNVKILRYISAVMNNNLYQLNLMRFYISNDNEINCLIGQIQYDRVIDEGKKHTDKMANRKGVCYPSYGGPSEETLECLIKKNKNESFYYNPQINYCIADKCDIKNGHKNEEKSLGTFIIEDFIEFIRVCHKYQNNDTYAD